MKNLLFICSFLFMILCTTDAMAQHPTVKVDAEAMQKGIASASFDQDQMAVLKTSKGDIVVYLFATKVPGTVYNFVELAKLGYYDGLNFHRVIPNFMIQGGCPIGKGSGNPGYKFADEFDKSLMHYGPGVLSMANSGPDTNGSQFFITHVATDWLNMKHNVFGQVVYGQNVVNAIAGGDLIEAVYVEGSKNIPDDYKHYFK